MCQYNIHFHNSVGLAGDELSRAISQAKTQEERLVFLFELHGKSMTPFEAHTLYIKYYPECPVTSIRRAMTNLTKSGRLIKTGEQIKEQYGTLNSRWKLIR